MSITEKRLNEIQNRLNVATKGPWSHDLIEFRTHMSNAVRAPQADELGTELVVIAHTGYGFGSPHRNASFIAHAREDIPALLAEVERLRGKLADAWDEGFDAGEKDAFSHQTFNEPCIPNPYRKENQ